jgi:hypothetical protein
VLTRVQFLLYLGNLNLSFLYQLPRLVQFLLQVLGLLGVHGQIVCQLLLLGIEALGQNVDL